MIITWHGTLYESVHFAKDVNYFTMLMPSGHLYRCVVLGVSCIQEVK